MWSFCKLTIWAVVWLVAWVVLLPFQGKRHNCLTWAVTQWDRYGGYLALRWCQTSRFKWLQWPHFMWVPPHHQDVMHHYIPKNDANELKILPDPYFDGKTVIGDKKGEEN